MNANNTVVPALVLIIAAGASTELQAATLHATFKACTYCACGTSEMLQAKLPAGRVVIKLRTSGWDRTNHAGYPSWTYYNAFRRDKSSWTGWGESLDAVSEGRIKWVKGKRTPENPKPGAQVSFEDEFAVSQPIEIQLRMSSQNWHDGSGACHQTTSENWLTIDADGATIPDAPNSAAAPTPKAAPGGQPGIGGTWREMDGACQGTSWSIGQQAQTVSTMSAQITCGNGYRASWTAENIRWTSAGVLTYNIRLSNGNVETQVTTFTSPTTATVEVYSMGQTQKSATVHIQKVDAAANGAVRVAGNWREIDGACQGTTWSVGQDGETVSRISAQITCGNGYRASWIAENIRWKSGSVLTYNIRISNGTLETQVTTFTSPTTATVEVYPMGQTQKSATVHIQKM